jgi:hypothetical protein
MTSGVILWNYCAFHRTQRAAGWICTCATAARMERLFAALPPGADQRFAATFSHAIRAP